MLAAGDGRTGPQLLDACRAVADLPQALAAVDLALWDAAGRRAGRPLAALLTDAPLPRRPGQRDDRRRPTARRRGAGRGGRGRRGLRLRQGQGRRRRRRRPRGRRAARGRPDVALRIDANGAWDVEEAVAAIEALARHELELVEEPVSGIEALRAVRERVAGADRDGRDRRRARRDRLRRGRRRVPEDLARRAGSAALLAQAALVRALGAEVYLASTLDGPLGIAAALHCAAALRVELPCGLATLPLVGDGFGDPLPVHHGRILLPAGPGLGDL